MSGSCSMGPVKRYTIICYFVKRIKLELVESVASKDIFLFHVCHTQLPNAISC